MPNLKLCLPWAQVTVSAIWFLTSSGKDERCRKLGTPKVKPLVMETVGGRPSGLVKVGAFTRLASSYGVGGCENSNSKSRPYWKRSSLPKLFVKKLSSLATPQVSFTKSLPKLAIPRVTV